MMQKYFSDVDIRQLLQTHYQMEVQAEALPGEFDFNYLIKNEEGVFFICKVADDRNSYDFFDAQTKIVHHLANTGLASKFSRYLTNIDGKEITVLNFENRKFYLRVLTFLHGEFWMNVSELSDALYDNLGSFLGEMDKALNTFSHPAMHRQYVWDINRVMDAGKKLHLIKDHGDRRIAGYFLLQFETEVLPHLSSLRHAYIHNDANDTNVLVRGQNISGLIDFGDMVYTSLINNLAVACTYAMMNQSDPIDLAAKIVRSYHRVYSLTILEIDLLYYLIAGRLCISVTQSAFHLSRSSTNGHHFVSERQAWDLLHKLIRINPLNAQDIFRKACGYQGLIDDRNYSEMLKERELHLGGNLSVNYKGHLKIVKSALQYLYDDKGKTYVDCVNNPSHVGHCHPVVVRRIQKQIATLNTNTRYLSDIILEYSKRLVATLPSSLSVCYFTNSGSEANDLAIRMSRHYTKRKDIIVLDHAYHGTSTAAMEISPYKFNGNGGSGKMPWIHVAANPDGFRGRYKDGGFQTPSNYANGVKRLIEEMKAENKLPAAFICETLLGVGGQMPLPPNYLTEVYKYVREAGGVCIADEVQVGFGRVGEKFWGFELQDVVPDIVVMGKPIGNGHPLAAVVVTKAIADAFNNGMEYFNTFGGNPVSMTAGLAVLDIIQQEEMQQHALEVGIYLTERLNTLMQKYTLIGDVRGYGLFIGVELVKDRITLEPAVPEINILVERMKDMGYLLGTDGPLHNVLKIKPPMPFDRQNADGMIQCLDEVLREL